MPHYGVLGSNKLENVDDIRGSEVYGVNDERLGKVDDVIFDHSSGQIHHVVVDTGGWLASHKFLVPANRISPYRNHEDRVYAELDKERIRMLPEYDEKMLKNENDWSAYEKRYQEKWTGGTIMRNERTGRIITPPAEEIAGTGTGRSEKSLSEVARDATPQHMGRQDELWGVASSGDKTALHPAKPSMGGRKDVELIQQEQRERSTASNAEGLREPGAYEHDAVPDAEKRSDMNEPLNANYGPRWQRFQEKLRQDRDRVVSECALCGTHKKVA